MAIQALANPSFTSSLDGIGGAGGSAEQTQIEQILEILIQELQQLLQSSSQDQGGGGGVGGVGGAGGVGGGAPSPSSFAADPAGGAPSPVSFAADPAGGAPSAGGTRGGGPSGVGSGSGGAGGDTLPGNIDTSNPALAITQDLESRYDLTPTEAAGALGNLQQESGLQGNINQGGATGAPSKIDLDNNKNGWGLAQWGGPRKQGEIEYAQQHNLDPGSLQANIGFMNQELDTDYSKTISDIKNTNSVDQAALVWDQDYEQASDPEMANRDQYAQQFLSQGL